jgi:hypothetical protein
MQGHMIADMAEGIGTLVTIGSGIGGAANAKGI